MSNKKRYAIAFILSAFLLVLILDTKHAVSGACAGIDICLKTIVPSLFPFLILSTALCALAQDMRFNIFAKILSPCRLPDGAETIFIISILGGYPIGAKLISDAYSRKSLIKAEAEHMLMFCNNAGPAFIFGMISSLFTSRWVPAAIWMIQLVSAYVVGILTAEFNTVCRITNKQYTFQFSKVIETMSIICGWIILFKILLTLLEHWFLKALPLHLRVVISGVFELSNGCLQLPCITNEGLRFLIATGMIAFGGFCITIQTAAIIGKLSLKKYLHGKLLQLMVSLLIAMPLQSILFAFPYQNWYKPFLILLILTIFILRRQIFKKQ